MYIRKLRIQNLRCFEQADLDFACPPVPAPPPDIAASFGIPPQVPSPPLRVPNVNLLLGDNGAGKTTVLRAVALSLLGPLMEQNSGWVPYHMTRRSRSQVAPQSTLLPLIRLHEQDEPHARAQPSWSALGTLLPGVSAPNLDVGISSLQITIERLSSSEILRSRELGSDRLSLRGLYDEAAPAFFVLGYGATRRTESSESFDSSARSKSRIVRYQRVAGLFEDHITLVPLSSWLPLVEDEAPARFEEIQALLNTLLPDRVQMVSTKSRAASAPQSPHLLGDRSRYLFGFGESGESEVPFPALSDGYRSYIGWIGDMLYHLNMACPLGMKLSDCRGVVMVDEVDLHLHPSWQRVVVDTLSQTFPRLQFILTTHSPIVAGTLEAGNIWVMEANADGSVSPRRYRERIFGLSADQILTSSYFSLLTTRAPEAEKEIRTLAQRATNGDGSASLEALRRLTGSIDGEDLSDSEIEVP